MNNKEAQDIQLYREWFMDEDPKTQELCIEAIRKDAMCIRYVPHEFMTPELCRIAVSKCKYSLMYIPRSLWTSDLEWKAIKRKERPKSV